MERGRFFHLTCLLCLIYNPVCATRASGHSGQPQAGDPPFTRSPERIPPEVLRDFVGEQARLHTYRALAKAWGIGHETLRKFAIGETAQPHARQLELYGTKLLELHPSGYVRETRVDGRARALEQLKMVLPPGRENAQEIVDRLFELAARHPDELPDGTERVREWLLKVLNAEYDAEVQFVPRRNGGRRKAE